MEIIDDPYTESGGTLLTSHHVAPSEWSSPTGKWGIKSTSALAFPAPPQSAARYSYTIKYVGKNINTVIVGMITSEDADAAGGTFILPDGNKLTLEVKRI